MMQLFSMQTMHPEEVYISYFEKCNYDNTDTRYWRYRSVAEIEEDRLCKCCDAGNYFYCNLTSYSPKRFYMEMDCDVKEPDMIHIITTFKRNDFIYIMEGTWWMMYGIHGPFKSYNAALRWVDRTYKYIWLADRSHPAPGNLKFNFYEFNEDTATGIDIHEFISAAKGNAIDITTYEPLLSDFRSDTVVVFFGGDPKSWFSLHELCNEHKITNYLYDGRKIEGKKLIYITHGYDTSKLPLPDKLISLNKYDEDAITVFFNTGHLKYPKLIKATDAVYDLVWFDEEEDKMHRFKQTAELLFEKFIKQ